MLEKAIDLRTQLKQADQLENDRWRLALVYVQMKKDDKAIPLLQEIVDALKSGKPTVHLAEVYDTLANCNLQLHNIPDGERNYKISADIYGKTGRYESQALRWENLTNLYEKENRLDDAEAAIKTALDTRTKIKIDRKIIAQDKYRLDQIRAKQKK